MIAVIRIHGRVELKKDIVETLKRLKLKRKFHCVLIDENDKIRMGMLNKVKYFVAYGKVDNKLIEKLKKKDKEIFRLHPPVGGFKKSSKLRFPKGILGKHDDISKLLVRMI